MSCAERNRQIKRLLEDVFGRGKVTTRGSRGTGYGWVSIHITFSPRNHREAQELRSQVSLLIKTAKIEIGTYGYDDPGSDYGFGSKMHINFDACRETADAYGPEAFKQHMSAEAWDAMQAQQAAA